MTKARRIALVVLIMAVSGALLNGCASVTPVLNEQGRVISVNSSKAPFGPDITYEREWEELASDGKTVLHFKEKFGTTATADKTFGALADVLGTMYNGTTKMIP